ncbi:MAG: hypothetical protein ACLTZY_07600 [Alistipes indistinctus]
MSSLRSADTSSLLRVTADNFLVLMGLWLLGTRISTGRKWLMIWAAGQRKRFRLRRGDRPERREAHLCDRAALLPTPRERATGGSSVARFHALLGAGG